MVAVESTGLAAFSGDYKCRLFKHLDGAREFYAKGWRFSYRVGQSAVVRGATNDSAGQVGRSTIRFPALIGTKLL